MKFFPLYIDGQTKSEYLPWTPGTVRRMAKELQDGCIETEAEARQRNASTFPFEAHCMMVEADGTIWNACGVFRVDNGEVTVKTRAVLGVLAQAIEPAFISIIEHHEMLASEGVCVRSYIEGPEVAMAYEWRGLGHPWVEVSKPSPVRSWAPPTPALASLLERLRAPIREARVAFHAERAVGAVPEVAIAKLLLDNFRVVKGGNA